eukprot:3864878-Prymnesium_polylepis.1
MCVRGARWVKSDASSFGWAPASTTMPHLHPPPQHEHCLNALTAHGKVRVHLARRWCVVGVQHVAKSLRNLARMRVGVMSPVRTAVTHGKQVRKRNRTALIYRCVQGRSLRLSREDPVILGAWPPRLSH